MKQIIEGLRYDTETAKELGEASYNGSSTDFQYFHETLYKTESGRYFLAGKGGPRTRWAHAVGNGQTGGSGIQTLEASEALEWAERYLTSDAIEAAFGEFISDA